MVPAAELIDELLGEILLCLPPDEPEHLFCAALVCKPWLRVLCDPAFLRRYRTFHGAPPLLNLFDRLRFLYTDPAPHLTPTTKVPAFPHPGSDGRQRQALIDCRHGRVLFHRLADYEIIGYLVWDPVTGNRHVLPEPDIEWITCSAVVLCAADGCDPLDCHAGPFRVVFVATLEDEDTVVAIVDTIVASVYSSETGAWSTPVSLDSSPDFSIAARRGVLIRDEVYFTFSDDTAIVKYNWSQNHLSFVEPPPPSTYNGCSSLMMAEDNFLGLASIEDSSLYLWSRKINPKGAAEWLLCRVIDLKTVVPMANPIDGAYVVGFAECVDVVFVNTGVGLFMVELKSGQGRKVDASGAFFNVIPYMSFYTPDHGTLLSLARTR